MISQTIGQQKTLQDVTDLYEYARDSEVRKQYVLQLNESYKFYSGDQWSPELKKEMSDVGAMPLVFNRVEPLVNTYTSLQIASRRRASFKSATGLLQHDILAQNVNNLIYNIQNQNDYQNQITQKFNDSLIGGLGWSHFCYDEDTQSFVYKREDPRGIFWDPDDQSQRLCNLNFVGNAYYVSVVQLKQRYPKYTDYFESLVSTRSNKGDDGYIWYPIDDDGSWTKGRSIKIVEIYYKKNAKYYEAIVSFDSNVPLDEDGVTSVEQYFCTFDRDLAESRKEKGTEVKTKDGTEIWKAVFCQDVLLESGRLNAQIPNQKSFPYVPLSLKRNYLGLPVGVVEGLVSPQIALNYVWTKTLHGLNSKYLIVDDNSLDKTKMRDELFLELHKRVGIIYAKNPQNAQFINSENLLPQFFNALARIDFEFQQRTQLYDEIRGQESNAVSGKAIQQRTVNNLRSQNPMISIYEYMLMTEAQLMLDTIRGVKDLKYAFNYYKDGKINYATLDQEIATINFEIFPDIAPEFSSVNEEQQAKFADIINSPSVALIFSDPFFLEKMGITKEEAQRGFEAYKRATQEQAQPQEGQLQEQQQIMA